MLMSVYKREHSLKLYVRVKNIQKKTINNNVLEVF